MKRGRGSEDLPSPSLDDPLTYALEPQRMAAELKKYKFLPWRWREWYRRRRIIEVRRELSSFAEDPRAYARETGRMAEELQNYTFPPWRWRKWQRRRRIIERRLAYLRRVARLMKRDCPNRDRMGARNP